VDVHSLRASLLNLNESLCVLSPLAHVWACGSASVTASFELAGSAQRQKSTLLVLACVCSGIHGVVMSKCA